MNYVPNQDMKTYIDSCKKESEIRTAVLEQNTEIFDNIANITVNSDNLIPQGGEGEFTRNIVRLLMKTMRQIKVRMRAKQLRKM